MRVRLPPRARDFRDVQTGGGEGLHVYEAGKIRSAEPVGKRLIHVMAKLTEALPGRSALLSIRKAQQTFGYAPKYRLGD